MDVSPLLVGTLNDALSRIDGIVYDFPGGEAWGWHEDQAGRERYSPVLQQVREEFFAFLGVCAAHRRCGSLLQIGLGLNGGAHFAFRQIFDRVVTVEMDAALIARFSRLFPPTEGDIFVHGNSILPATVARAEVHAAGCDVLFIDGDHRYEGALHDLLLYGPMVRPGGIIAFHDTVPRTINPEQFGVDRLVRFLTQHPRLIEGAEMQIIGKALGIGWFVRQEAPRAPAECRLPTSSGRCEKP